MTDVQSTTSAYEAPAVVDLGSLYELTLAECIDKRLGGADGHTFMGQAIQCSSA